MKKWGCWERLPQKKKSLLNPFIGKGLCVYVQPRFLFSATSVLRSQTATCFEYAALLCSLLLGANYDAYCVSGYASKEMCLLDQRLQDCPLLDAQAKVLKSGQHVCMMGHRALVGVVQAASSDLPADIEPGLRFQREPKSRFLTQQAKKKQQEAEAKAKQQEVT